MLDILKVSLGILHLTTRGNIILIFVLAKVTKHNGTKYSPQTVDLNLQNTLQKLQQWQVFWTKFDKNTLMMSQKTRIMTPFITFK
jgi:hypothetical protein